MTRKRFIFAALAMAALVTVAWWHTQAPAGSIPPAMAGAAAPSAAASQPPAAVPGEAESAPATGAAKPAASNLWGAATVTEGHRLEPKTSATRPEGETRGRTAYFDAGSIAPLKNLQRGSVVTIPLPGGEAVTGVVNLVQPDADGGVRVGGALADGRGSFSLGQGRDGMGGRVLLRQQELAYLISTPSPGRMQMQEWALADVMCYPLPRESRRTPEPGPRTEGPQSIPPALHSRPGSGAVLYLDFDGATVNDPDWNDGNTINAAASTLNAGQITEVWSRVSEDYAPFNINVTTIESEYAGAAVGRRMRIIITTTDSWYPDAGGVAYRSSFGAAGTVGFSTDVPAWAFDYDSSADTIAEAAVHELGHTLGLRHDGRTSPAEDYYDGHGGFGAVSWGPIMGSSYDRSVVQWSKGEYPSANNQEDDVAIISGSQATTLYGVTNNTGYVADDAGNSRGAAAILGLSGGTISQSGLISSASDSDFYVFTLGSAASLTLNANPANTYVHQPNLDIALELQDGSGSVLASSNPDGALNASITQSLSAGTYYVKVAGTGRSGGGSDYGYTSYGSLGAYSLGGTLVGPTLPSFTTQPAILTRTSGLSAQFTVSANGNPTPAYQWQRLPAGGGGWSDIMFNGGGYSGVTTATLSISSVTLGMSGDQFRCRASNSVGSVISDPATLTVQTAPAITTHPGNLAVHLGMTASFSAVASGTGSLTYQWQKNGVNLNDGGRISGSTTATLQIANVQAGDATGYRVVVSNLVGSATSVAASLTIVTGPVFAPPPLSRIVIAGQAVTINSGAVGTGTVSYAWTHNGQVIAGANAASLQIGSASRLDSGHYTVTATDSVGSVKSVFYLSVAPVSGRVTAWGENSSAQINVPVGLGDVIGVGVGDFASLAIRADGTVTQWGELLSTSEGGVPAGLSDVVQVEAGEFHALALKGNGTVVAWGYTGHGATNIPAGLNNVVAVAAGDSQSLVLKSDGTVVQWGSANAPPPNGLTDVVAIACGRFDCFAVKADGTLVTWGSSLTTPAGLASVANIAVGWYHALALKTDGTVAGWSTSDKLSPPAGLADVCAVSASYISDNGYNLVLRTDGSLVAWGNLAVPAGLNNVYAIATGGFHSLALAPANNEPPSVSRSPQDQAAFTGQNAIFSVIPSGSAPFSYQWQRLPVGGAWADIGNGGVYSGTTTATLTITGAAAGQSGDQFRCVVSNPFGSATSASATLTVTVPVPPTIVTQPASQTANEGTAAAYSITVTGSVPMTYQWQFFSGGSWTNLGTPSGTSLLTNTLNWANASPGDSGRQFRCVVTNAGGSVTSDTVTLTVNTLPVVTGQPSNQTAIETGSASFTITASGTPAPTYQWQRLPAGGGSWGNVSNGGAYAGATGSTLTVTGATQAMGGDQFRCVATNVVGSVTSGAATLTVTPQAFIKLSAGRYHSLRLDGLSRLYVSGTNTYGQLGNGNTTSTNAAQLVTLAGQTIVDLAGSAEHSLLLTTAKEAWAAGLNANGQLGDGTTLAKSTPAKVATSVVGIGANRFHSAFLKADATLWTVGGNDSGQLGDGTTTDSSTAAQVATGVVDFSVGIRQTLFIKADGTLWGMGDMNGSGIPVSTPMQIATNVKAAAAGGYHSIFVKTDGTLWTLGFNAYGQLGTGNTTDVTTPVQIATGVKAVAAGYFFSLFIKTDNTLWAAGYNNLGQLGDGSTTTRPTPFQVATNVTAVSASESYTLFTRTDGSLWATGLNGNGQFGNGGTTTVSTPVQITTGAGLAPNAPIGLTAGVPALPDRVHLTWNPTVNATRYEVWRATANDSSTATRIAQDVRWSVYEDLTASSGVTYYYWVKAVNPTGTSGFGVVSSGSFAGSGTAPAIATQPVNQTVAAGEDASFSVTVTGSLPLVYQWQMYSGGTWTDFGTAHSISALTTGITLAHVASTLDGLQFRCVVSNSAGSATTNPATLTVTAGATPVITIQPVSQTVNAGSVVVFIAAATGSPAPTFQWKKDGVITIGGATSAVLTLSGAQPADIGSYTVTATNSSGSVTSEPATLALTVPEPATSHGNAISYGTTTFPLMVPPGAAVTFNYLVTNTGTQAWGADHHLSLRTSAGAYLAFPSLNGVAVGGSTSATFSFTAPAAPGTYTYYVEALQDGVEVFGGPRALTLTVPVPATSLGNAISYNTTNFPATALPGAAGTYTYNVTNTGTRSWGPGHHLSLRNSDGAYLIFPSLDGVAPGASKNAEFIFAAPAAPGIHTYYLEAQEDGVEVFGPAIKLTLTVPVAASSQGNAISYGLTTFPATAAPGAAVSFTCSVTNTGTQAWGADHHLSLRTSDGTFLTFPSLDGVATGGSKVVNFTFNAPATPGVYTYYVEALQDGVEVFGLPIALTLTVPVSASSHGNAITYNTTTFPATAAAGATVFFTYNVTNTGTQAWGADHHLSLRAGDGAYLVFPSLNGVAAGGGKIAGFTFTAPATPGVYTYYVEALQDGVEVFGLPIALTLTVPVPATGTGNAINYNATTFPATATAGAAVSFTYNVTNTGTRAWGANHHLSLRTSDGSFITFPSLDGVAAGGGKIASFTFTAPATPGVYTYYVGAQEDGAEFFGLPIALTLTVPVPASSQGNAINYNATTFPATAAPGAAVFFTYNVANTGTQAWGADHHLSLRDGNGTYLTFPSLNGVAAGGGKIATFTFTAPAAPGVYTYYVEALQDGAEFFGLPIVLTLTVPVPTTSHGNAVNYGMMTFPATAAPGAALTFTCSVTNTGTQAWGADHHLSLRTSGGTYLVFPSLNGVAANGGKIASFTFTAPATPGVYTYYVQAQQDGVEVFGLSMALVLTVPKPVTSQGNAIGYGMTTFPATATAGAALTFTYSVTNTGTQAWGTDHHLSLRTSTGTYLTFPSLNGVAAGRGKVASFTFTAPGTPGTYTYYVEAQQDGVEVFGLPMTLLLTVP